MNGNFIKEYTSKREAYKLTGTPVCQISAVTTGRQKTAHGYIWRNKEVKANA